MADFSVITLGSSFSCAAIKPDNFTLGGLCQFGFYIGNAQQEAPQMADKGVNQEFLDQFFAYLQIFNGKMWCSSIYST